MSFTVAATTSLKEELVIEWNGPLELTVTGALRRLSHSWSDLETWPCTTSRQELPGREGEGKCDRPPHSNTRVPVWGHSPALPSLPTRCASPTTSPFPMYFTGTQGLAGWALPTPLGQGSQALSLSHWYWGHRHQSL